MDSGELRRVIADQVAGFSGIDPAELDPDRPLEEYGLSSRDAVALAGHLEVLLDRPLSATLAWEHPTIAGLAHALAEQEGGASAKESETAGRSRNYQPSAREPDDAPIAVVGIGCRFPGGKAGTLGDPERLWRFLLDGGEAVGEIPPQRWSAFDDGSPAVGAALAATTRWAATIDDIAGFDATFFGIAPREAAAMDPQQRLLLEVSWEALEHAGIPPRSLRGSRTGVFAGLAAAEYAHLTTADLGRVDAWTATGAAGSVAAGRISYLLDLRGPSIAVDTACSSSLVAVHLAVTSLRLGESDLALAGGVNLLLSPVITMTFDAGGGTSPDGRCRAFDAAANGMVRGEGCGVVVLKRLADARRDGDRVLAVVTGSAVNCDGRSNGLVAPNGEAQRDLLRTAYASAGTDPRDVDYVEAHGTGTPLGDPIEARALGEVLGADRPAGRPLLIGSVKSNIGHLEAAAGVAGLIKTVLALSRRQIPPTAHFTEPSPHIALDELGLAVPAVPAEWPQAVRPTAGVSSFGFSGTNAHVVLTAPPDGASGGAAPSRAGTAAPRAGTVAPRAGTAGRPLEFVLSDVSKERVQDQAARLAAWLEGEAAAPPNLESVAATLSRRAGRGTSRSVVVARDLAELAEGLSALGAGRPHQAVVSGTEGQTGRGAVFLFSGYGSQWQGMGKALATAEPVFAAALEELEAPIRECAGFSLCDAILGGTSHDSPALNGVARAQPVLFGMQMALARLWAARGVQPSAVIGHSMGEVAAAATSGALTAAEAAQVIATRSRLLTRLVGGGAMALVGMPAAEVTDLASGLPDVHLAVISSPVQAVVTGEAAQVAELARRASARGAAARVLQAEGAGHSPQVDPLLPELMRGLAGIAGRDADLPFYSTVHDDPRDLPRCDAAYWAANLRKPVRLAAAVAAAARDGLRTFVEISPHPLLRRALAETLEHEGMGPGVITGTLRREADDVITFYAQRAALTAAGLTSAQSAFTGRAGATIIDMPPAPWRHEQHWADPPPRPVPPGHPLLGTHVSLPDGRGHVWHAPAWADTALSGLRTVWHGISLFPLSAAAEMAVAAACEAWDAEASGVVVTGLKLGRLLAIDADTTLTTTLNEEAGRAAPTAPPRGRVEIYAQHAAGAWTPVAAANVAAANVAAANVAEDGAGVTAETGTGAEGREVAIPPARWPRGQHVPVEALDACLNACGDGMGIATAIGTLRVHAPAIGGGICWVRANPAGNGGRAADLLLMERGQPLLEVRDVAVRDVTRAAIPMPYRDKLLELSWCQENLPRQAARPPRRWIILIASGGSGGSGGSGSASHGRPGASPGEAESREAPCPPGLARSAAPSPDAGTASPTLASALADVLGAAGHGVEVAPDLPPGDVGTAPGAASGDTAGAAPGDAAGAAPSDAVRPEAVLIAPPAPVAPAQAERFVLHVMRVAAIAARRGVPRLWVVTAGAAGPRAADAVDPGLAALRGLIRVLALEQPGLRATLVDLDPAALGPQRAVGVRAMAATLAGELAADSGEDEVAWRDGSRFAARLVPAREPGEGRPRPASPGGRPPGTPRPASPEGHRTSRGPTSSGDAPGRPWEALPGPRLPGTPRRPVVRPGGAYIITGGYGGLGLVVARWLATRGAARLVLSGRSGPSPAALGAIDEIESLGAAVHVVPGDAAEPAVARRLVAEAQGAGGQLSGVVHAAGVFADALVGDVTPEDLARVWAPKAHAAWSMHEATRDSGIDWFVLFSSAAALLGSPGQAAYATANAWLDAFARWRRSRGLPTLAIGWGVWSQAGRAGDVAIRGIDPLNPDEGIEALEALLAEDRTMTGVVRIDPATAAAAYPEIARIPYFASLLGQAAGSQAQVAWPGSDAVRAADPLRRRALIDERVRSHVAAVLGLPAASVSADLTLAEAGMDSLAAQRISNLAEHDFAVTIDPALLLAGATVAKLQDMVAGAFNAPGAAAPGAAAPGVAAQGVAGSGVAGSGARAADVPETGRIAPSPDPFPVAGRAVEPRDAVERQVTRIAEAVLGTGPLGVTDDLRAVGLTARAQEEIAARLTAETGRWVDAAALFGLPVGPPTLQAAAAVLREAEGCSAAATGLIREIRPAGPLPPLLLAHPAGGTTGVYSMLAGLLGDDRPVFGLERLEGSLSDRAARYAEEISGRFPAGDLIIGGWSFGGVLAYEAARRLARQGRTPALVVLLDAALPLPVEPGTEDRALAGRFAAFASYLTRTYGRAVSLDEEELFGLDEDAQLGALTQRMAEAGLADELPPAILRHQLTSHEDTRALERYEPGPYHGPVVLYRADLRTPWAVHDQRYEITDSRRGWGSLCDHLDVVGVDAHHLNLLDPPAVHVIAAHLQTVLTSLGGEK
jgi:phthiocerol/phenolphthiocerol synthesis type-I polyketide synthase D